VSCIDIRWDHEQHLVTADFHDSWCWDDFHRAVDEIHATILQMPGTVNVMIIHRGSLPNGNPITHFSKAVSNQPPNLGKIIMVAPDGNRPVANFLRSISRTIHQTYPGKRPVVAVDSMDEARRELASSKDDTLPRRPDKLSTRQIPSPEMIFRRGE
jgi:hypothetical protein